jgi:hypothetical protein
MKAPSSRDEACLDLALPGAQRPVRDWVPEPANDPGLPIGTHCGSDLPQVIYAERRPCLSGPELLARHKGVALDEATREPSRPKSEREPVRGTKYSTVGQLRPVWWGALMVTTMALFVGSPLT